MGVAQEGRYGGAGRSSPDHVTLSAPTQSQN